MALGFATGRLPKGLGPLKDQLGADGIDVVHNGAQVFHDGAAVATWPLPRRATAALAAWCMRHHVYAEFYVGGRFYATDLREEARPGWEEISGEPDGLVGELDLAAVEVTKATVNAFAPTLLSDILEESRSLGFMAEVSTAPCFPGLALVNVTRSGVDKGTGVAWAAGRLGIAPEDLLVVGDGDNDVPMFRVAGTAVAMGQAPDHVIAAAHLVTGSVEDDGLAQLLGAHWT
jgi:Cof subfamily protein (haloacid dehalogenase superfamily)